MTPPFPDPVREWLEIARKDWGRIQVMLAHDDPEAAGTFLQQAMEKYLKAWLILKGWRLRKIHELDALLDESAAFSPELISYAALCERVSGYYYLDRYPPLGPAGITATDVLSDASQALKLIQTLFPGEDLRHLKEPSSKLP